MLRPASCPRPAGVSPVRVGVGAPGGRRRLVVERWRVERGVESLFGGSERAGCDCSLVSEDRSYKPMVKSSGGQRESEGAMVVVIGVQKNAPGAKGPHVDRACVGSERQDMTARLLRPNHPGGCRPGDGSAREMARSATRRPVAQAQPRGRLWEAAKQTERTERCIILLRRGDSPGRCTGAGRLSIALPRQEDHRQAVCGKTARTE